MPNTREKLIELLYEADRNCNNKQCETCKHQNKKFFCKIHFYIDHLIAHGVTVQELDGCFRCKDSQKMNVTISNKLIDGVNTGWLGGNLPARYCPFCGRRLPQPPKGE